MPGQNAALPVEVEALPRRKLNRGLRLPVETSFADYVASHWETYISQNLKPSTQASHRSNVKAHLLLMFGKLLSRMYSMISLPELSMTATEIVAW